MENDANQFFAEAEQKKQRLLEQLSAAPLVTITGLVDARGAFSVRTGSETRWTVLATLTFWRLGKEALQSEPITLRQVATQEEAKRIQDAIPADTVVRFKARVVMESVFGGPQGLITEVVGETHDDIHLNGRWAQSRKPVYHIDPKLGAFKLERKYDWFSAQVDWLGQQIELRLSVEEAANVQDVIKVAHTLWEDQGGWDQRARQHATGEYLTTKNESWLGEDEPAVTAEDFQRRLELEAITVTMSGYFEYWFKDGDLFNGHWLEVSGNLEEGPKSTNLMG